MATYLSNEAVGNIVKIMENGVATNYIVVHKGRPSSLYDSSCDGVWVLRERTISKVVFNSESSNDYENSELKQWLNGVFLNTIDSTIRNAIKTVKIPYKKGHGQDAAEVMSGASGLSCKVFSLSGYELGFTQADNEFFPIDGSKLSYFSDKASRIAKNSSGSSVAWWMRSPRLGSKDYPFYVIPDGGFGSHVPWFSVVEGRPAFILPNTLVVTSDRIVSTNALPIITGNIPSGTNLGELGEPIDLKYSVSDFDKDPVTVREYVDNVLQRSHSVTLGAENTFEAANDPVLFQKILNGQHTLKIIANDGKDDSAAYTVKFNKQVKTASISLANPLPADDAIRAAVVSVTGVIPRDVTLEVLVTNNALDDAPVWENMTKDYEKKINHVFTNQTAENGFAFNFKVTVTRGVTGEQGFIEKIGGAFQ